MGAAQPEVPACPCVLSSTNQQDEEPPSVRPDTYHPSLNGTVSWLFVSFCSGGGKTTIASMLMKLYDVHAGHILVDGVPLDQLDTKVCGDRSGSVWAE